MFGGSFITGDSTFTAVTEVPAIRLHEHVERGQRHRVGNPAGPARRL